MNYGLDDDLELTINAVKAAANIIMGFYENHYDVREKSPNNPVTDADIASDKYLHSTLLSSRPDYGWISEEIIDDGSRLHTKRSWVVDPLDGTKAFIKGMPHFTISVGLIENHLPILGVVCNPVTKELFTAIKGHGAFKNGAPIHTSNVTKIADAHMLGDAHMYQSKKWTKPWDVTHIEQRNSIAYRMALVACGEFDAAIATTQKNDWDLAAGTIILQEAGGFVGNHLGEEYSFNNDLTQRSMLATCQGLKLELLERLKHIK